MSTPLLPHETGINGAHHESIADCNNASVPLYVEATLNDDLTHTCVIDGASLRKAAGVANQRQLRFKGIQIETHNETNGPVGICVKRGDGKPLALTSRAFHVLGDGADEPASVTACNHVAKPRLLSTSGTQHFKEGIAGLDYKRPENYPEDHHENNMLNCAFYPGNDKELTEADAFRGTISAEKDGKTMVAVRIKDMPDASTDSVMTQVISRALGNTTRPNPRQLSATGAIKELPDPDAPGTTMACFVDHKEAMDGMFQDLKRRVDPPDEFRSGIRIEHHGNLSEGCKPGDKVFTQINVLRDCDESATGVITRAQVAKGTPMPMTTTEQSNVAQSSQWQQDCHKVLFGHSDGGAVAKVAISAGGDDGAPAEIAEPPEAPPAAFDGEE